MFRDSSYLSLSNKTHSLELNDMFRDSSYLSLSNKTHSLELRLLKA